MERVHGAQAIITVPAVEESQQIDLLSQSLEGINNALHEQGAKLIRGHTMEGRQRPLGLQSSICKSASASSAAHLKGYSHGAKALFNMAT